MNVRTIRYGWSNIYLTNEKNNDRQVGRHIWDKEEEAKGVGRLHEDYVATVYLEWEE